MATDLLKLFLEGNINSSTIIQCLKNEELAILSSMPTELNLKESVNKVEDFVPNFLDYLRTKLSVHLSPQQAASCSPKRKLPTRKTRKKNENKCKGSRTSLLTRYSPDSQSDTSRSFDTSEKSHDNSLSRRDTARSTAFLNHSAGNRQPKRVELLPCTMAITPVSKEQDKLSHTKPANASANLHQLKHSTQEISSVSQKKRITPTLITHEKKSFDESEETKVLFDSSPVLEASESSLDSDGSASKTAVNEKKIKKLEKKMRKGQKNEVRKMPLAAFLTSNQRYSTGNKEQSRSSPCTQLRSSPCVPFTPDIQKVYQQRLVSSPICVEGEEFISRGTPNIDLQSSIEEKVEIVKEDPFSLEQISNKDKIAMFVEIYECIFKENLIANITMELYFLFGVLNCKVEKDSETISDEIFSSSPNCVYFVAEVLEKMKHVFVLLDKSCLKLVAENPRLLLLSPSVVDYVNNHLLKINDSKYQNTNNTGHSKSLGVPFQVEINNRKTFSSDRYFYSFSKLRDKFYGLIRNWEENHLTPEWNVDIELGKEFQDFFQRHDEFPTFRQFSQLFVSQLVEMCKQDFSILLSKEGDKMSTSLPSYLRGTDPAKLQLLQERLVMPAISRGPCPKAHFTDVETFFQVFIKTVDSYQFSIHLKDAIAQRLLQINSSKFSTEYDENMNVDESEEFFILRSEFSSLLSEARLLAKFLGFIVFLPYSTDRKSQNVNEESLIEVQISQPFDPKKLLTDAMNNGELILTIPWLVMYLSMMDLTSLKLKINRETFNALIALYRLKSFRFGLEMLPFNKLFILVQLGWLFEQPNIATSISFYTSIFKGGLTMLINAGEEDLPSLDTIPIINKALFTRFCPFLSELKLALVHAGARSYRKIKPFTHIEKIPNNGEEKRLKERLIENFLKYQPKYVKESVDFIVERLFGNLKTQITTTKSPSTVKLTIASMEKDIVYCHEGPLEIETLHKVNDPHFKKVLLETKGALAESVHEETTSYCDNKAHNAVSAILPMEVHHKVIETTAKIISNEVRCKMAEWITMKLLDLYEYELNVAYNKHLMSILKRHNKSFTSM